MWTHIVNHLCHDRHKKLMPDPENFADFLEDHPRLKKAMEDADAYFASVAKMRKKMDAKGGSGLIMATAEEAAFLRNR